MRGAAGARPARGRSASPVAAPPRPVAPLAAVPLRIAVWLLQGRAQPSRGRGWLQQRRGSPNRPTLAQPRSSRPEPVLWALWHFWFGRCQVQYCPGDPRTGGLGPQDGAELRGSGKVLSYVVSVGWEIKP